MVRIEKFFEGIGGMVFVLITILITFAFVGALNDIGFSEYIVNMLSPILIGPVIPALAFISVGIIAFCAFSINPYITMAAIASGSVFGGTACFFSEQMLMCAHSVECSPVRVALCGFPYSIAAFILSVGVYLIVGFSIYGY